MTTEVEAKATTRPDEQVEVTFAVTEGNVTKIDNIVFTGNRTFSDRELRDVITTSQSGWFDILKTAAFYDPERIKQDRDLLRQFYLKNGFPDVRVVTADAVKNEQGTGYSISFTIEEGERYTFGPTTIQSSIGKVDTASLQSTVTIKPGSTYNAEQVDKSVERMTLSLSDQGHASANVRMVPKRDEASRTISMAIEVQEGTPIYVERIEVVGNTQTKDFVIRRELRFVEGDPVNAFILERARKRMQALGFFKKVTLKKKTGSSARPRRRHCGGGRGRYAQPGVRCGLFDLGRYCRRHIGHRAQSAGQRAGPAREAGGQRHAAPGRTRLYRAPPARHQLRWRFRPLLQGHRLHHAIVI